MVLQSLSTGGPGTADEIAERLAASPLTIRPRISELRNAGKVHDTGQRSRNASGKSAAVWAISKGGEA
jgi:predicted ArsR family transcriptional regulator